MKPRLRTRALRIAIVLFPIVAGVSITLVGALTYAGAQFFDFKERELPPGFLAFSSMELKSLNTSIGIIDLNFTADTSNKAFIAFEFELSSFSQAEQVVGFQVPYMIGQVFLGEGAALTSTGEGAAGDLPCEVKAEVVRAEQQQKNGPTISGFSLCYVRFHPFQSFVRHSFRIYFSWSNFLTRTEYTTYGLIMPFARQETDLHQSIRDRFPAAKTRVIRSSENNWASLSVSSEANLKTSHPTPTSTQGLVGYHMRMLTWDVTYSGQSRDIFETGHTELIVAYFELGTEVEKRNNLTYQSGIYIGLGFSLFFSGIYEALKYAEQPRTKQTPQDT